MSVNGAVALALPVLLVVQTYLAIRSARRTTPRPRIQYAAFSVAYLIVLIAGAATGVWAESDHVKWLDNAMIAVVGFSFAGSAAMFGRAAFHGKVRRAFWRMPPPWLDQDT